MVEPRQNIVEINVSSSELSCCESSSCDLALALLGGAAPPALTSARRSTTRQGQLATQDQAFFAYEWGYRNSAKSARNMPICKK